MDGFAKYADAKGGTLTPATKPHYCLRVGLQHLNWRFDGT